jgi:hypothetical protein
MRMGMGIGRMIRLRKMSLMIRGDDVENAPDAADVGGHDEEDKDVDDDDDDVMMVRGNK